MGISRVSAAAPDLPNRLFLGLVNDTHAALTELRQGQDRIVADRRTGHDPKIAPLRVDGGNHNSCRLRSRI